MSFEHVRGNRLGVVEATRRSGLRETRNTFHPLVTGDVDVLNSCYKRGHMTSPKDFPLAWPADRPRTPHEARLAGKFRAPFRTSYDSLFHEAERLHEPGVRDREFIISTAVPLSATGQPIVAEARHVGDPGVAVYVWRGDVPYAIACDTYREVRHNMRALWAVIQALRIIQRHSTSGLLTQSMSGFQSELSGRPAVPMLDLPKLQRAFECAETERRLRKSTPPCAASMGCLCAAHARDAAAQFCDASE